MDELITYSKQLILEQSEELIIEECKRNPRRFEPLYNKYYKPIFRLVLGRIGDKDLTADLVSNVFFKALQSLHRFQFKGLSIYSWLYRIALNECNEHFRKAGSKRVIVLDQTHYEVLTEEMAIFDDGHKEALKIGLSKLKEVELQIIELRFFESLSFKDIADVLGITEGNSKVKLYRAVEKLKKLMKVS
ncbi:RNA polymerase sigma factor [Fulvivirga sp.]|uniref:RNA polymerase sigma factor n=1 Tax=Fulvivirga sp. TaxID=1931237 RepID=UPI0032EBDED1